MYQLNRDYNYCNYTVIPVVHAPDPAATAQRLAAVIDWSGQGPMRPAAMQPVVVVADHGCGTCRLLALGKP